MPDFTIRSDSVDVEQIMAQIRSRIRDKRGVDYTEAEVLDLARVKLEKFLDPAKVRSELLDQYRKGRRSQGPPPIVVPPAPPNYAFDADTAYVSSRGLAGRTIRLIRRVLNPLLKLFINPNPIIQSLHMQGEINAQVSVRYDRLVGEIQALRNWLVRQEAVRAELDALNYEVLHNLVVEVTRTSIEVKNHKMRVESLASRLDFDERRARALEGVVQYRQGAGPLAEATKPAPAAPAAPPAAPPAVQAAEPGREGETPAGAKGEAQRSRRRRRRRGRGAGSTQGQPGAGPHLAGGPEPDDTDEDHGPRSDDPGEAAQSETHAASRDRIEEPHQPSRPVDTPPGHEGNPTDQ